MADINAPAVVAEITALHDAYERALAANDVPALNAFFWDSPYVVRFGVAEHLYGAEAVALYRHGSSPEFTERTLLRRTVLTFGTETASVMCELKQSIHQRTRHTRQSQHWVRFPRVGWKIVSAHVSHALNPPGLNPAWDDYVDHTAAAIGLPIERSFRSGVVQQLQRTAALVSPLLAFPLPADVEAAPVFTA